MNNPAMNALTGALLISELSKGVFIAPDMRGNPTENRIKALPPHDLIKEYVLVMKKESPRSKKERDWIIISFKDIESNIPSSVLKSLKESIKKELKQ